MRWESTKSFLINLSEVELMPFMHFLKIATMPVTIEGRWSVGNQQIQCSLILPTGFDPAILTETWDEWKREYLAVDYAILN